MRHEALIDCGPAWYPPTGAWRPARAAAVAHFETDAALTEHLGDTPVTMRLFNDAGVDTSLDLEQWCQRYVTPGNETAA